MQPLGQPMESTLKTLGGPKGSYFEPPHEWSGIVWPTNTPPPPLPKKGSARGVEMFTLEP